jgi:DNA topoisomerase IB
VGGESYAEAHNTYGLATLRKEHVVVRRRSLMFEYDAKGGIAFLPSSIPMRTTSSRP